MKGAGFMKVILRELVYSSLQVIIKLTLTMLTV